MLTTSQRERILAHLEHGWKLPDSLLQELWEAYEALERTVAEQSRPSAAPPGVPGKAAGSAQSGFHHSSR